MRRHFKPELLNRLDEIVIFDPLSHEQLKQVARLQMKDVARRLAERGIALAVTDAALHYVLAESYDPVSIFSPYYKFFDNDQYCDRILKFCAVLRWQLGIRCEANQKVA